MKKLGERLVRKLRLPVPGVFLQRTSFHPAGTAERMRQRARRSALFYRIDEQAVTPVGNRRSRYFLPSAPGRATSTPTGSAAYAVTEAAFHEDKALIEAQQKLIDLDPTRRMLPTSLDAGPTQFRRLVEGLQAAEQANRAPATAVQSS